MNIRNLTIKEQVLEAMRRVYSNALTTTSGGNISAIDENGHIFITPSSIDKGMLTLDDIVEVLPDGTRIGRHVPSMELPFHSNIYKACPDIKAVVHAHAPAAVAYACMNIAPDSRCTRVYADALGKIVTTKYALPGSQQLGNIVMQGFRDGYRTVMMDNHGATVGAPTMAEALMKYETLDYLCRTLFHATGLGGATMIERPIPLPKEEYSVRPLPADEGKKKEIVAFIRRAYRGQLVGGGWGTLALRDGDGFLFNPAATAPEDLSEEDVVKYEKGCLSHEDSCAYLPLIGEIFAKNPEANAVFLSMPAATMGFAVANKLMDARLIPESYIMLKDVVRLPYAALGKCSQIAGTLSKKSPAVVIDNECAITIGKNATKAFDRMEVLDYSARSVLLANSVAKIRPISQKEVDEIDAVFNGW